MKLAPSAHATHNALVVHLGIIKQKHLGRHRIDGIHDIIERLRHEVDDGLVFQVLVEDGQLNLRIDVTQTLGHYLGFWATNSALQGQKLAVAVGDVHHIAIDDSHFADARAGQLLGGVCPYSTQSDHKHVLGFQGVDAFIAD